VLSAALRAPDACKTSLKPSASQELLYRLHDDRAQGSRAGLEAFFVGPHVTVEVIFKQLIEPGALGMSWPVGSRRFCKDAAAGILGRTRPDDDRRVAKGHGRQQTSQPPGSSAGMKEALAAEGQVTIG
jgi:hypothetical protein